MKFKLKPILSCFFLILYLLIGLFGSGCASVCLGNDHSRHIGINILGYEPCCKSKEKTHNKAIIVTQNNESIHNKCDCDDLEIKIGNVSQITTQPHIYLHNLFDCIKIFSTQYFSCVTLGFSETHNKINWDIYRYRNIQNSLSTLNTVILII